MKLVPIFTKPVEYVSHQWDGEADVNIARWCGGSFRAKNNDLGWVLILGGTGQSVFYGDWICQDENGNFFCVRQEDFDNRYTTERST